MKIHTCHCICIGNEISQSIVFKWNEKQRTVLGLQLKGVKERIINISQLTMGACFGTGQKDDE